MHTVSVAIAQHGTQIIDGAWVAHENEHAADVYGVAACGDVCLDRGDAFAQHRPLWTRLQHRTVKT